MLSEIATGLMEVRARLTKALELAHRASDSARLIAVSKTFPPSCVEEAYASGQRAFGENRVQELQEKVPVLPKDCEWHLIGHLQANKVRHAVELSSWIHSVDSLSLLRRVESIATECGTSPKILLEVNISGEESKFGLKPEEVEGVLTACPGVLCTGLMTVAPLEASESDLHQYFAGLRTLRDNLELHTGLHLPELSMGMSHDFEIAVSEGATMIRVGTAIFGHRTYPI